MTRGDKIWLWGSLILSYLAWCWITNWGFGLVLIGCMMIHEYGHYWQMGQEGIADRRMLAIPLLGAVAQIKEPWPSCLAEARIALAGPILGMFPGILAFFLWLIYPLPAFAAVVILVSAVNLFNLIPLVPILDGGRVLKSILFSLNRRLGESTYLLGPFSIVVAIFFFPQFSFVGLILLFFTFLEFRQYQKARIFLQTIETVGEAMDRLVNYFSLNGEDTEKLEKIEGWCKKIADSPKMSPAEISKISLLFCTVIALYVGLFCVVYYSTGLKPNIIELAKHFKPPF